MHPTLSDLASTVHRADLRVEGALWAERPRAGRSVGVCCPA